MFYSFHISLTRFLFHKNCGQFISLDSNRTTARRVDSYNHGVVLSETPLPDNHLFQVSVFQSTICYEFAQLGNWLKKKLSNAVYSANQVPNESQSEFVSG